LFHAFLKKALAGGGGFNYIKNGADWPQNYLDCSGTNQSPINLLSPGSKDAFPLINSTED
jgi:hypothetical protein